MKDEKKIWDYTMEEIQNGFTQDNSSFRCILCGKEYENGRIYSLDGQLYDAYGAVKQHIREEHGTTTGYLLQQGTNITGISDVQRQILQLISEGKSDKEIGLALGIVQSTVRNHRFKLREKEKQAKLFLAMMESLKDKTRTSINMSDAGPIEELHVSAAMVDERYSITGQDCEKTLKVYMNENGAILQFPAKEKKKIILMREVIKNFKKDTAYTEKEVNQILKRIYEEDYPTLRRSLIEYGFMERAADGSVYRVRE